MWFTSVELTLEDVLAFIHIYVIFKHSVTNDIQISFSEIAAR